MSERRSVCVKTADFLLEEFEKTARSLMSSENASSILPGILVVRGKPLNSFRNSVVEASMSYEEGPSSQNFLDKVRRLRVSETSSFDGETVTQEWHYEREGGAERFVFSRTFERRAIQETAVLRRNRIRGLSDFEFHRDDGHTIF